MYICTRLRTKALLYVGCSAKLPVTQGVAGSSPVQTAKKPSLWGLFQRSCVVSHSCDQAL